VPPHYLNNQETVSCALPSILNEQPLQRFDGLDGRHYRQLVATAMFCKGRGSGGGRVPHGLGVHVEVLTPSETDCLKKLINFEGEVTTTRVCNPIIAGVDEEHKDAARLFCKTYHGSPDEYRFQAGNTSQFNDNGVRKYCGHHGGPLHPTAKQ